MATASAGSSERGGLRVQLCQVPVPIALDYVHLTPLGCGDFGRLGRRDLHTPARVKPCLTHQSRNADSESDSDSELFGGTFWVEVNEDQSDDWFLIVLAQPVFGLKKQTYRCEACYSISDSQKARARAR